MIVRLLEFLYQRRTIVKWLWIASLAVIVVGDFFVERHDVHFFGDSVHGFWSIFGLVICLALIVSWKWLAHVWLERDEDYYDN